MRNQRLEWIDVLKGLAIMLVFMGHQFDKTDGTIPNILYAWIYSFHMPLFFFLSGITFSIDKYKNFGDFVVRKIKTLLVPMLFFSIVKIVVRFIFYGLLTQGDDYTSDTLIWEIRNLFTQEQSVLWFFSCLFVVEIAMYFMVRMLKNKGLIVLASLLLFVLGNIYLKLIGAYLPWRLQTACIAIIFLAVGYCIKKHLIGDDDEKIHLKNISTWWALLAFALSGLSTYINYLISGSYVNMASGVTGNPALYLIQGFSAIAFLIIIFSKISTIKPLRYIGENSLIYYGLGDVVMLIPEILQYNILKLDVLALGNWGGGVAMIIYAIIMAVILWPLSWFIRNKMPFVLGKF